MKLAIVIPDGAADEAQPALGGRTPLQAAYRPHMNRLARMGQVGRADNVPGGYTPASDVATLSLLGYDPRGCYTGRAPIEAFARGLKLGPHDWAIRCNLVTTATGRMDDFTAGHITTAEAATLLADLQAALGAPGRTFHPGVAYRHLLLVEGTSSGPFAADTFTQPPHDIPDRPVAEHQPRGPGADLLTDLMQRSQAVLADHPVNRARAKAGKKPATQVWLWGQGQAPALTPFQARFGLHGAMLSGVDLVRGVGGLLGWDILDAPGMTDYLDNDYQSQGAAAVAALDRYDVVCVHVEASDEASHEGRCDAKVEALEKIDRDIVGPLLAALPRHGNWRLLVTPDHPTPLRTRAHARGCVPFVIAGTGIAPLGQFSYDEATAALAPLSFPAGHELLPWLLSV
ncbi:MAG TPA: cofactor-independent phosphoglycerate mutase [Gemmatales bacterium]|nr:cofactor-independent phosphoglycerate mutase [Gemmatales bacterium]